MGCDACIEYIKKVKSMQFKLNDASKDKENMGLQIAELKKVCDQKDEDVKLL